ncbi:MAG TPA: phenylalanine--tRNA ligase subunit alpha [Anaerolineae bacterium]|nr:phenylalanine--tRNA ligase subunit alpha [Anaerolineae bacterium]
MLEQLKQLREDAQKELETVSDPAALEQWRVSYLGKKGRLTLALRGVGKLPPQERPAVGRLANETKAHLERAFKDRAEELRRALLAKELTEASIDVRLPGRQQSMGYLHITTQTLREIYAIFADMGFQVLLSGEVEDDLTNFQLLNMPPGHPARDMWSTFYTTRPGVLLRSHTSPGQIHAMRKHYPRPIRVILPGKCYRYEQITTRSEQMFFQVEGLAVGHNITMADLKGVLVSFVRQMFGANRRLRFRPSYFPFTEPSAEVDIDCILCRGEGCQLCKHTGWLEILGSGMVHPNVLQNGGYDPEEFSGFAFGMGVERICMLKHGITDIRYFYSNDLRFLQQFG